MTEPATATDVPDAAAIGAAMLLADLHEAVDEVTAQLAALAGALPQPVVTPSPLVPAGAEPKERAPPVVSSSLPQEQATPTIGVWPDALAASPAGAASAPAWPPTSDARPMSMQLDPAVSPPAPARDVSPSPAAELAVRPAPVIVGARSAGGTTPPPPWLSAPNAAPLLATPTVPPPPKSDIQPVTEGNSSSRARWGDQPAAPLEPAPNSAGGWPQSASPPASAAPPPSASQGMASAAPPPASDGGRPTGGDVFLDGAKVGRWLADTLAREAGGPAVGGTGFDPRLGPTWPGALQGNG